jgi:septal ring factor EnvC (AmiA/AmiB activator)
MMEQPVRRALILDYARLGRFTEMEQELETLDEQRAALARENADIAEKNRNLQDDSEGLLRQYESQNEQIEILKAQRNHYRLAFFGLLAIALFIAVLFVAYKIVRKKRTKIEKG